jgi:hypothetical protein
MATEKFTTEQMIDAIRKGHTPTGAASVLKCHPDTIRNYADRYPTVKRALLSQRREIVDLAEIGLRAAVIRKESWAIAFALKTLGKSEGYVERQEHTGADGNAITIKVVYGDDGTDDTPTEAA